MVLTNYVIYVEATFSLDLAAKYGHLFIALKNVVSFPQEVTILVFGLNKKKIPTSLPSFFMSFFFWKSSGCCTSEPFAAKCSAPFLDYFKGRCRLTNSGTKYKSSIQQAGKKFSTIKLMCAKSSVPCDSLVVFNHSVSYSSSVIRICDAYRQPLECIELNECTLLDMWGMSVGSRCSALQLTF